MLKEGLVTYLASDAHRVVHYDYFAKAYHKYEHLLIG